MKLAAFLLLSFPYFDLIKKLFARVDLRVNYTIEVMGDWLYTSTIAATPFFF